MNRPPCLHTVAPDGTIEIAPLADRLARQLEETARQLEAAKSVIARRATGEPESVTTDRINRIIADERRAIEA